MLLYFFLELKNRIILMTLTWSTIFIICYNYKEILLYIIIKPCINTTFKLNKIYFITTNVTEIFNTYIYLSNFISNKIIFFFFLIHFILFINTGLYKFEIYIIKKIILVYIILSMSSIIFLYYIILPLSWNFFFNFQDVIFNNQLNLYFEAKLSEYLNFFVTLNKLSNILSQIFTIVFIYINSIQNYLKFIKEKKKIIFFFLFLITTLITPPDIFSQLILGSFINILYEIFIIITLYINLVNKVNR
jgi:sec-independent protein translocase protein TatC